MRLCKEEAKPRLPQPARLKTRGQTTKIKQGGERVSHRRENTGPESGYPWVSFFDGQHLSILILNLLR
jgi:hypothetical protein